MGVETFLILISKEKDHVLKYVEIVYSSLYSFELVLKMLCLGYHAYFDSLKNKLDFWITVTSVASEFLLLVPGIVNVNVVRALLMFRLLRFFTLLLSFKQFNVMFASFLRMVFFSLFCLLLFFTNASLFILFQKVFRTCESVWTSYSHLPSLLIDWNAIFWRFIVSWKSSPQQNHILTSQLSTFQLERFWKFHAHSLYFDGFSSFYFSFSFFLKKTILKKKVMNNWFVKFPSFNLSY